MCGVVVMYVGSDKKKIKTFPMPSCYNSQSLLGVCISSSDREKIAETKEECVE